MPAAVARPIPVVIDNAHGMYFRPEGAELVLIGLEDDSEMGGSPDRETAEADPDFRDRATERIIRRVPGLIDGTFRTSHSGQDGLTPDQRPILGAAGPRRLLPRLRPQRHRVQDGAGRGPRDGGADPGRGGDVAWTSRRSRPGGSPRGGCWSGEHGGEPIWR